MFQFELDIGYSQSPSIKQSYFGSDSSSESSYRPIVTEAADLVIGSTLSAPLFDNCADTFKLVKIAKDVCLH